MNDILLATIPAALVLVATLGARFIEHYLQSRREAGKQRLERERETRDAKRRYRESIAAPIREALTELQRHLGERWMLDTIARVTEGCPAERPELKDLIKERVSSIESADLVNVVSKLAPLVAAITDMEVRQHIQDAFLWGSLGKGIREEEKVTDEDMDEKFALAFRKLEDYVTLAD